MSLLRAIGSGVAGACAVTLLNESGRRVIPREYGPPRMDVLGKRGITRPMEAMGFNPPRGRRLTGVALAGDVLSNSLFYSLIGAGRARHPYRRGMVLGLLAGIGAAVLPPVLGLGRQPHQRAPTTHALTILWYLAGGLAAAATARAIDHAQA